MDSKYVPERSSSLMSALKPLYLTSQLFGLAPFTSKFGPSKIQIGYSLILTVIILATVIKILELFVKNFHGTHTTYLIPLIMKFSISGISAITGCVTAVTSAKKTFTNLTAKIGDVDGALFKSNVSYKNVFKIVTAETALVVLASFSFGVYTAVQNTDVTHLKIRAPPFVYVGGYAMEQISLLVVIQFLNCVYFLKTRYRALNEQLATCFNASGSVLSPAITGLWCTRVRTYNYLSITSHRNVVPWSKEVTPERPGVVPVASKIRAMRKTHNQLFAAARLVNSYYGHQLVVRITYLLMTLTNSVYSVVLSLDRTNTNRTHGFFMYYDLGAAVLSIVEVVLIGYTSHVTSDEAGRTSLLVQDYVLLDNLDNEVAAELNGFARQLSDNKLVFTAYGLFTLDRTLLVAVVGTATSYIIILLQN